MIRFTCKLAANLTSVWHSGDYYQKQIFQNTLFPSGLAYDSKIEHYRTPIVNKVVGCIADFSKELGGNKNRTFLNNEEKSGLVEGTVTLSNQINSHLAKIDNLRYLEIKS